ncbi:MAG: porin family protein [Nitrospira sp.]|nr:porin family protein [Nitrospira sp.]
MYRSACRSLLVIVLTVACWAATPPRSTQADDNRWGFGSDVGFTAGTVDDTVFNLGFNLDYYPDENFSFGPMMQIAPIGNLFQFSLAGVGKYHIRLDNGINIVPFAGIGFIHNSLDRRIGWRQIDESDTSWYIPVGVSLEYQVARNIAMASTVIVNLHDVDMTPALRREDKTSVALMFGFRWGP